MVLCNSVIFLNKLFFWLSRSLWFLVKIFGPKKIDFKEPIVLADIFGQKLNIFWNLLLEHIWKRVQLFSFVKIRKKVKIQANLLFKMYNVARYNAQNKLGRCIEKAIRKVSTVQCSESRMKFLSNGLHSCTWNTSHPWFMNPARHT